MFKIKTYKLLLFLLVLLGLYLIAIEKSASIWKALSLVVTFIIVWMISVDLRRRHRCKPLISALKEFGTECQASSLDEYKSGFIKYGDIWSTASVRVGETGIRVYHLGVGNVEIEWKFIESLKKISIDNFFMVRVYMKSNSKSDRNLLIPYQDTMDKFLANHKEKNG